MNKKIFRDRYALTKTETWQQACNRVAEYLTRIRTESGNT